MRFLDEPRSPKDKNYSAAGAVERERREREAVMMS